MGTRQTPQGIMICQDGYNPNTPRNHGWPNGFNPTPQGIIMNGQHTWAQSKHPNNGLIAWHCLSFWSSMHHDMEPMIVNLCLFWLLSITQGKMARILDWLPYDLNSGNSPHPSEWLIHTKNQDTLTRAFVQTRKKRVLTKHLGNLTNSYISKAKRPWSSRVWEQKKNKKNHNNSTHTSIGERARAITNKTK